MFDFTDILIGH